MNATWQSSNIRVLAIWSALFAVVPAQATPIKVYVQEEAIVNAGTSYLGLHLLQPDGTKSATQEWNVYVGSFNIGVATTLEGPWTNELAFCVDPWNWSASGRLAYWKDSLLTMSAAASATSDIQALTNPAHVMQIEALYSNYYQGTLGNSAKSAAFQLALWELVSDNQVEHVSQTNSQIWNDGQSILASLGNSSYKMGSQHYDLTAFYADRGTDGRQTIGQNYLVASVVPEPASIPLVGLALAGLSIGRRRKSFAIHSNTVA